MSRRFRHGILVMVCAVLLAGSVAGCNGGGDEESGGSLAGQAKAKPTLDEFFDADSLTGDFTVITTESDGSVSFEGTGTLWVDGRTFRYSLWQDGVYLRDVMSPDGETAYFAEVADKTCTPAVGSVDSYLAEYSKPATGSVEDGIDEETGATRVVYAVQSMSDMAGAANAWYTEDITYLIKDGVVIGVETRGDAPNDDGTPLELRTSRRMFLTLAAGEQIPPETFELPYPVKNAE